MDRASVTLGTPDSSAGIMDGSVIGIHRLEKESGGSASAVSDRIDKTLSQYEAAVASGQQDEAQEKEVILGQLWFDLPHDERSQFGNCFSRMLLKCLNDTEQEQEVLK